MTEARDDDRPAAGISQPGDFAIGDSFGAYSLLEFCQAVAYRRRGLTVHHQKGGCVGGPGGDHE